MLRQYPDFDVKNFGKTFITHPAYDGRLNGFDVMVMVSQENADKVIETYKKIIDKLSAPLSSFTISYDDTDILDSDKLRIKETLTSYYKAKFDK